MKNPEEEFDMNKTELVAAMAEKAQLSKKDAEAALKALTEVVTEELKKHIAKKGFDPAYGARPLRRAIQTLIEDKLAEEILDGNIKDGDKVKLTYENDSISVLHK